MSPAEQQNILTIKTYLESVEKEIKELLMEGNFLVRD